MPKCPDCAFADREQWVVIIHRKHVHKYQPRHSNQKRGGYCDACNLPGCLSETATDDLPELIHTERLQ